MCPLDGSFAEHGAVVAFVYMSVNPQLDQMKALYIATI
jgi:hypothetical protein